MGESKEEKASRLSPYRKQYFHWRFIEGYEHTEITGKFEKLLKLLGETNIPRYEAALGESIKLSQ